MLVVSTAISGSGRKEYCDRLMKVAKKHGRKIKIYHTGPMMLEHAKAIGVRLTPVNVLNSPPAVITALRSAVFEKILAELPRALAENDAVLVNIHAMFYWKKVFQRAWDVYYISKLNPDFYISFVDDALSIFGNLQKREQWHKENLTFDEILLWRNVDVETASLWADIAKKEFFVIPSMSHAKLLYRLLFEPNFEKVYAAMPLTHFTGKKGQTKVDRFIKMLQKYYIVFDPREIELIEQWTPQMCTESVLNQIVNRDLYWLIKQVDRVIAYFPAPVSSPGVINELREAHETSKESWLVYPKSARRSPFLDYYTSRIFGHPRDLFKFLEKKNSAQ